MLKINTFTIAYEGNIITSLIKICSGLIRNNFIEVSAE
jgi:hypothetical protein